MSAGAEVSAEKDHRCDTGNFDRTLCPEPCGSMHSFCSTCGERQDPCAHERQAETDAVQEFVREHGARDVLSAVLDMAVAIYGEEIAAYRVVDLVQSLAAERPSRPGVTP